MAVDSCPASWIGDSGCQLLFSYYRQFLALPNQRYVPASKTADLYSLFL